MSDNEHAAAIIEQAHKLAEGNIWAVDIYIAEIETHADALARQLETALTDLGDFETMDQENADLRAQLAAAEQRAETQLKRAERLAQAIMGLCEGDANDIEFELDLYPLDLYDQTDGDLDAAPGDPEGERG